MSHCKSYTFDDNLFIPVFCFNKNLSRIAISPNNENINIYKQAGNGWALESVLKEHTERVTGIDWSSNNRILTCAADRNAYVWTEEKPNEWRQSLVLLRIDRAAINAKWAPSEQKFAVGTGSKLICVCFYEESNDWWVSKHIKKPLRSSVLCIDWHPNSTVIAAGSSDFCVRLFSAGVKEIEKKPTPTKWGDKLTFGNLLVEFPSAYGGWIHSVSFSPDGDKLVWVSHDSTISVADCSSGKPTTYVLKLNHLPLLSCLWINDTAVLAAGHNNCPYKFVWDGSSLNAHGSIDVGGGDKGDDSKKDSAMNRFKNFDKMAQAGGATKSNLATHTNTIKVLTLLSDKTIASAGMDSKIAIWSGV